MINHAHLHRFDPSPPPLPCKAEQHRVFYPARDSFVDVDDILIHFLLSLTFIPLYRWSWYAPPCLLIFFLDFLLFILLPSPSCSHSCNTLYILSSLWCSSEAVFAIVFKPCTKSIRVSPPCLPWAFSISDTASMTLMTILRVMCICNDQIFLCVDLCMIRGVHFIGCWSHLLWLLRKCCDIKMMNWQFVLLFFCSLLSYCNKMSQ